MKNMTPYPPPSKAFLARLRKLQTRKGREESGRFLAEGKKLVEECFLSGCRVHTLLASDQFSPDQIQEMLSLSNAGDMLNICMLPEAEFHQFTDTSTPQGVIAEAEQPKVSHLNETQPGGSLLLVLDAVQEPGNVGAAIRSGAALGADGAILAKGCADVWNSKTVRASAGAVFKIPLWTECPVEEAKACLRSGGWAVWTAEPDGASIFSQEQIPPKLALVFGNESHGVSSAWHSQGLARAISLPMKNKVESLNIATALAAFLGVIIGKKSI